MWHMASLHYLAVNSVREEALKPQGKCHKVKEDLKKFLFKNAGENMLDVCVAFCPILHLYAVTRVAVQ